MEHCELFFFNCAV